MAAGNFTATQLGDVIGLEAELMQTSRVSELKTSIVAAQALMNHQDHFITQRFEDNSGMGQRCVSIKVATNRFCGINVDLTPTQSCEVEAGTESESEAITLDKENLAKINFRVLDNQCNNVMTFERLLADNILKAKAKLEVRLAQLFTAEASAAADTPLTSWFNTDGAVNNNTFIVDPTDWKSDLIADIRYAMALTKGNDPIILNGNNFYTEQFLAAYKGIACCDNDSVLLNGGYDIFFDIHNIDQVLGGKYTLAVDKNALIFWSAPDYLGLGFATPTLVASDTYLWVDTLPRLRYSANGSMDNPVYVDVRMKRICTGSGVASVAYGWDVELIVRGVLATNLANCDGYQGVLKIKKSSSTATS